MPRPFRRRVLYVPGYDPVPARRYREIYRREGAAQARISGYRLDMGARADRTGFGWAVTGRFPGGQTHSEIEVLAWADVVQGSMGRSIPATYGQLLRTVWAYVGSGALFRLMRLRRGPVIAALYPVAVLLAQAAAALLVAAAVWWVVPAGAHGGAALIPAGAAAALLLWWFRRIDGRLHAYYLMHDFAFTAQCGGAYPAALERRIAVFADRVAQVLAGDWDEVLVVGHSSGAHIAISVLADVIRSGHDRTGDAATDRAADGAVAQGRLALLTLGHVVPMASFLPGAGRLRDDLRLLSTGGRLFWVDVTAPGDACCFGLCDPVAVSVGTPEQVGTPGGDAADRRGPLVLSAAFRQTLSQDRQKALRGHWFKLHFQYLNAFDRPGAYDYFAITAGPLSLADRFAGRAHSPGRIARAVNDWPGRARGLP